MSSLLLSQLPQGDGLGLSLPMWLLVGFAIAVAIYRAFPKRPNIPLVGFEVKNAQERKLLYSYNAPELLQRGYDKFKDRIFGVDSAQGLKLILPYSYLEELARHPGLSFSASLDEDILFDYTFMGGVRPWALSVFRKEIIPNLGKFTPVFNQLIEQYMSEMLKPVSYEWTPTNLYPKMLKMLGVLTARVMMGPETPHDPVWVPLSLYYFENAVAYCRALKFWPEWIRPVACYLLPQRVAVQKSLDDGRSVMARVIKEFDEREKNGIEEPPPPAVLYFMSRKSEHKLQAVDMHLKEQLNLAIGGIHTTSSVLTQTLFELAFRPEYIPALRKEAMEITAKYGRPLNKTALWEMHKLDSFVREVHRLHSPNLTTLQRLATEDVTLSDGTFFPKGTKLEIPTCAVHRDNDLFENGTEFDGYRFLRKRQQAEAEESKGDKHHYVAVRKDMIGWGYGKSACPGRFLADIEIKLILAYLLPRFDFKNEEGRPRHKSVIFENQVFPDPVTPVLVKRIRPEDIDMATGQAR